MPFQNALPVHDTHFSPVVEPLTSYKHVSQSEELRDTSNEAGALLQVYIVNASSPVDVFNAKFAAEKNIDASGKALSRGNSV